MQNSRDGISNLSTPLHSQPIRCKFATNLKKPDIHRPLSHSENRIAELALEAIRLAKYSEIRFNFRQYDDEELRIKKKDIKEPSVPIEKI